MFVYYTYFGAVLPGVLRAIQGKWPTGPWWGYLIFGAVGFLSAYAFWMIGQASRPVPPRW